MTTAPSTNALLGFPEDARLLIINADDFGMCHANNQATMESITDGLVTSTTLMTPCPWAPHAMQWLKAHPEVNFGVHLTLIAEHDTYRWGPLASKSAVSSLLDEAGYFYTNARSKIMLADANLDEIEIEYRTQIGTVLGYGLKPTHLDWHCLYDGGRPDITELTFRLAREFGLAARVHNGTIAKNWEAQGLPAAVNGVLDSYSITSDIKVERYTDILRSLPAGLSEWAVHPGLGNAESLAMEPTGWDVRKTDYDFVTSDAARQIIQEEGITLLSYRELQAVWTASTN